MSVINDNIRRLDQRLDKLKQQFNDSYIEHEKTNCSSDHLALLEYLITSLSASSKTRPLRADQILDIISKLPRASSTSAESHIHDAPTPHSLELSWLIAAKAAVQTLGVVSRTFLDQTLALNDEILYWDNTLGSPWQIGLYTFQTSPSKLWESLRKAHSSRKCDSSEAKPFRPITLAWAQFYKIVQKCMHSPHTSELIRPILLSPFIASQREMRKKGEILRGIKNTYACSIGILMKGSFLSNPEERPQGNHGQPNDQWHGIICDIVSSVEIILQNAQHSSRELTCEGLLDAVENKNKKYGKPGLHTGEHPERLIERLAVILGELFPAYTIHSAAALREFGRPPLLVRYWLPMLVALLSTSSLLGMLKARRHEIIEWFASIGTTVVGFWSNWVLDPIRKLIGTIRHDEKSEIALMSKNSLEADRASLERMVVDFIHDRGEATHEITRANANDITTKIQEGDLTPVLRAYEKDLRTPFVGTVRGDLVRALLIQIQKTKVDVEIAISGIDALLKSQELVFGFVGLTPGILVSYASLRWLYGLVGSKRGLRTGRKQDEVKHALRDVHRTLVSSATTSNGLLTHRDRGILMCDVEILLRKAAMVLDGLSLRAFRGDIGDLVGQSRVDKQLLIVDRITWVYTR